MLQNKVQIVGNLGSKIELKEVNGKSVANFSIASDESYKDAQGAKIDKVVWHRVVAWGKTAEILEQHTQKGSKLAIEGRLIYNKYTKEKDGVQFEIPTAEILVTEFLFLGNPIKKEE